MNIPKLEPDIEFIPLKQNDADRAVAFEYKRAAMGPHIVRKWGWDEQFQRDMHAKHYANKPFHLIRKGTKPIGVVSIQHQGEHIQFGEFYLDPEQQGKGIGTAILKHALNLADQACLPVRLEYLHWNPVGSLYLRHGFKETSRSDIHAFLERPFLPLGRGVQNS